MSTVACIGMGTIGRSWAVAFARGGFNVNLFDVRAEVAHGAIRRIERDLKYLGKKLPLSKDWSSVVSRLRFFESLDGAVHQVSYVQESVAEAIEVKRAVFNRLDALCPSDVLLASSTSEIPLWSFTSGLRGADRCIVAHPVNPPHLIPAVEIVRSEWTSDECHDKCVEFMKAVGQIPIMLRKEVPGFIINRLQFALVGEALRLIREGVCTAADVDSSIKYGLGLRWSFMGPFETAHLNADGGFEDYVRKFHVTIARLLTSVGAGMELEPALVERIHTELCEAVSIDQMPDRQHWRDLQLARRRTELLRESPAGIL